MYDTSPRCVERTRQALGWQAMTSAALSWHPMCMKPGCRRVHGFPFSSAGRTAGPGGLAWHDSGNLASRVSGRGADGWELFDDNLRRVRDGPIPITG